MMLAALIFCATGFVLATEASIVSKFLSNILPKQHPDANLSSPQIITKYGYPVEVHNVTTDDGYILTLFRIPYGKNSATNQTNTKGVIFVQHCLLCSSDDWLVNFNNNTLPFLLADSGYDVWLGNSRGNTYSRGHTDPTYDSGQRSNKYWDFSWHEMGVSDIPAVLDNITSITNQSSIYYVGHSMGTTMFFVCMSEKPEYNSKIKSMYGLAPVAYIGNASSPVALLALGSQYQALLLEALGEGELIPESIIQLIHTVGPPFCIGNPLCSTVLYAIVGYDPYNTATITTSNVLGHTPASTSTNTLYHFFTNIQRNDFLQMDYGLLENLMRYNSTTPPRYDLSKVTARTTFYYGGQDTLATPKDLMRTVGALVNSQNELTLINEYNHLDFTYGTSLYAKVLASLISKIDNDVASSS